MILGRYMFFRHFRDLLNMAFKMLKLNHDRDSQIPTLITLQDLQEDRAITRKDSWIVIQ